MEVIPPPPNRVKKLFSPTQVNSSLGGMLCALGKLLSFLLGSSFRLHGVGGGADLLLVTVHAADSMRGRMNSGTMVNTTTPRTGRVSRVT